MKDKMDRPKNDELLTEQQESTGKKTTGVDSSRRRLFGAGIAAPVILSMSSRTAWGGGLCGPSAFNSMTFSSHAPQAYVDDCTAQSGRSPSYWLGIATTSPAEWNYGDPSDASPFLSGANGTMLDVLTINPGSVEAHGIAALLNANASLASGNQNLFGQSSSATAQTLVLYLFPDFIDGNSVNLPGTTTSVSWLGGSYPMVSYFTNYLP
ncbi:hypothetical protein [Neptunomonas sp.]|uniref:hypothetical protein n=1 Tax=Neptunomonas sp. TaxID=1971898 RepID=UPI0035643071